MAARMKGQLPAAKHVLPRQSIVSAPSQTFSATSTTMMTAQSTAPSTEVPLTTTFTPPASCIENHFTFSSPGFLIWVNEPVPASNLTSSACFPSEYLQQYTSVSSNTKGSSIVPAMSPLVCPSNYCTANVGVSNYAVCCPSAWGFHPPDTKINQERPGYGGVCYSSLTESSIYTVTAYDATGRTSLALFTASKGDQAFAHPIDGFATSSPTLGCSANSKRLSGSAITAAVVGGLCSLTAIIVLAWCLLRYLRRRRMPPLPPPKIRHIEHDSLKSQLSTVVYEKDASLPVQELEGSNESVKLSTYVQQRKSEMNGGRGPYEMSSDPALESKTEHKVKRKSDTET